jgi:long-chain acyl-CoA synthetase
VHVSGNERGDADLAAIARCIAQARCRPGAPPFAPPVRSLGALLALRANGTPEREFLVYQDEEHASERRWTYARAADAVARAASVLRAMGVRRGDRVGFLIGNLDHAILLYLATWALGACVVPVSAAESEQRKRFILENSSAVLLAARGSWLEEARRIAASRGIALLAVRDDGPPLSSLGREPCYPDCADGQTPEPLDRPDVVAADCEALLVYTSGTTGPPKGVVLDQGNLLADADAIARWHGWDADTRTMCVLPVHHVNGIVVTHVTPLYVGGSNVLQPRFQSRSFWKRIADEGVTVVSLVPTLLEFLLDADRRGEGVRRTEAGPSRLRAVICGAGPLLVDTALEFEARFGVPLIHGYGLSETTAYNCHLPPDLEPRVRTAWLSEHGFPSIGCALPHHEMAILREDGTAVSEGERGEICVRGDTVSRGYHGRPDANRAAFAHGWFRSGDEGFLRRDAQGRAFFFITGRIKELIIRGGINYSPLEIDQVLTAHPAVQFGLAVPFENRWYGEEIAAYVVPREGESPSEAQILQWCRERLDFARAPKVVVLGSEIPYTTTGKPKRIELARQLAAALARYRDEQFRR